jgi:hypothetical protein
MDKNRVHRDRLWRGALGVTGLFWVCVLLKLMS